MRLLAVTKSGAHLVVATYRQICIISLYDGEVVRQFGYRLGVTAIAVDPNGLIFVAVSNRKILCFTEDGLLVRTLTLVCDPMGLAFFADGRMVLAEKGSSVNTRLAFYTPGCDLPVSTTASSYLPEIINDLKVSKQTSEIYVVGHGHTFVKVFSMSGEFIRQIGNNCIPVNYISLTDDDMIFASNTQYWTISLWTCKGAFVQQWYFKYRAQSFVILPCGLVAVSCHRDNRIAIF